MTVELNEHLAFTPPAAEMLGRRIVSIDAETGVVSLIFFAKDVFGNRHGTVQGGMLAAMLDSATATALLAQLDAEHTSVTAALSTDFVRPAPLGPLSATAWLVSRDERGAEAKAELHDPAGQLVARGVARLRIRPRKTD